MKKIVKIKKIFLKARQHFDNYSVRYQPMHRKEKNGT